MGVFSQDLEYKYSKYAIDFVRYHVDRLGITDDYLLRIRNNTNNPVYIDIIENFEDIQESIAGRVKAYADSTIEFYITGITYTDYTFNQLVNHYYNGSFNLPLEVMSIVNLSRIDIVDSVSEYLLKVNGIYKLLTLWLDEDIVYTHAQKLEPLDYKSIILIAEQSNVRAENLLISDTNDFHITKELLEITYKLDFATPYLKIKANLNNLDRVFTNEPFSIRILKLLEIQTICYGEPNIEMCSKMLSLNTATFNCMSLLYLHDTNLVDTLINIGYSKDELETIAINYVLTLKNTLLMNNYKLLLSDVKELISNIENY